MRSDVMHELIGYDPSTNRIVYREKIPPNSMHAVLLLVGPDENDPDAIDSYAIELRVANDIIELAKLRKGPQDLEYFVESLAFA
jgi:hypothetical protein